MCITKCIFRLALIGGIGLGAAVVLAGPQRVGAGFAQVREKVQQAVDARVDEPVAIRRQLQSLASELPEKIGEIRGELTEVEGQIAQLRRDNEVAERVIAMSTQDLQELDRLLTLADAERAAGQIVQIRFNATRFDVPDAKREFHRIDQIRMRNEDRVAANSRDLDLLSQQRVRLAEILGNLENEYAALEAEMWQIDRKIEALARNDRLVETLESRQQTLDQLGRYQVKSLDQLRARLARWETESQAKLDVIERRFATTDYENRARREISSENIYDFDPTDKDVDDDAITIEETRSRGLVRAPRVIE